MKKNVLFLLVACLFLGACGNQESASSESSSSSSVASSELADGDAATSETAASSSAAQEVEKTEVYQYQLEEEGIKQLVKETLVYKGDEFLKIEIHITQETDEEAKASFATVDFETVKSELLTYIDQSAFAQQLRAVPGVDMATDVSEDYAMIMDIKIDMTSVDLEALSNVEDIGTDFTELADITPANYILGLKLRGAEQVQ